MYSQEFLDALPPTLKRILVEYKERTGRDDPYVLWDGRMLEWGWRGSDRRLNLGDFNKIIQEAFPGISPDKIHIGFAEHSFMIKVMEK